LIKNDHPSYNERRVTEIWIPKSLDLNEVISEVELTIADLF